MAPTESVPLSIVRILLAVRRRRRALAGIETAAWMMGGLALLLTWADLAATSAEVPSLWIRSAARAWLVAVVVGPAALFLVPAWQRTSSLLRLARAVDDRVPETRGSLLTAVDLGRALDTGALAEDHHTQALARAHLQEAGWRAYAVSPRALLPLSALGRRTLVGPIVAAFAVALLAGSSTPLGSAFWTLVGPSPARAQQADSDNETPASLVLRNLRITLAPPAYAQREPLVLDGTSGDFQALPGTRVTLEADLPNPGRRVILDWAGQDPVAHPLDGADLELSFVVPGRGNYRLVVERGLGREPLQTRRFRVEALPDHPPELEVLGADDRLDLSPDEQIELRIRAGDDFALSRLERVVLAEGRELARIPIAAVADQAEWTGSIRWQPALELAGSGGELELVIEAWDNDTVNGPKVTRSRPIEIHVPTARDQHVRSLHLKERLLSESLDFLAILLVDDHEARTQGRIRDEVTRQFDRQHRMAVAVLTTASELRAALQQDRFEQQSVFLGIAQTTENLARRWQDVVELIETEIRPGQGSVVHPLLVGQLLGTRASVSSELERIAVDLSAFIELQQGQDALENLADTEPLLSELADLVRQAQGGKPVQESLSRALDDLAQKLSEVARKLAERSRGPDDGFANRLPSNLGPGLMEELQQMFEEGRYDEAMERIQRAMDTVSELTETLDEERNQLAGGQERDVLSRQLAEAIEEAKRLEAEEEQVIEATRDLQRRFGSGEPLDEKGRQELAEDMDRLHDMIQRLPTPPLPARARGAVRQRARLAERMSSQMREAYEEGDLDEATELGEAAENYLDDMDGDLARSPDLSGPMRNEARAEVGETRSLARRIVQRMQRGQRQAQNARRHAAGAGEGARRQQLGVQRGVGELRQQVEQIGGSAFNPVEGRDSLDAAGELMGRAGQRLAGGQPTHALAAEQDALRQLRQFRKSLEASQMAASESGMMGSSSMARNGPGADGSRPGSWSDGVLGEPESQKVEMPDPEDFVGPEAFRSLVQEGAGEDAPERYRPFNHSYYEELVR